MVALANSITSPALLVWPCLDMPATTAPPRARGMHRPGGATLGHTCRGRMLPWVVHRSQSKTITFYSRKYLVIAQFLAVCGRSQWSRHLTTFPLLALAPGTLE